MNLSTTLRKSAAGTAVALVSGVMLLGGATASQADAPDWRSLDTVTSVSPGDTIDWPIEFETTQNERSSFSAVESLEVHAPDNSKFTGAPNSSIDVPYQFRDNATAGWAGWSSAKCKISPDATTLSCGKSGGGSHWKDEGFRFVPKMTIRENAPQGTFFGQATWTETQTEPTAKSFTVSGKAGLKISPKSDTGWESLNTITDMLPGQMAQIPVEFKTHNATGTSFSAIDPVIIHAPENTTFAAAPYSEMEVPYQYRDNDTAGWAQWSVSKCTVSGDQKLLTCGPSNSGSHWKDEGLRFMPKLQMSTNPTPGTYTAGVTWSEHQTGPKITDFTVQGQYGVRVPGPHGGPIMNAPVATASAGVLGLSALSMMYMNNRKKRSLDSNN
ncbi:hypothetical protein [Kocuria massiliensis]|uniref:hypothetical protein n=1 Tax=Kocuria massiliensis TaxID=1926282 RepID=UPI0022B9A5F0|nr:hypothetical protein [Kocuria massiliensis]